MSDFAVFAEGLDELATFEDDLRKVRVNAARAINKIARDARAKAAREIREQVNLPARYVSPSGKGLYIGEKASPNDLETVIRARQRPTSLARFVRGRPRPSKAGVYVEVAPGKARFMKRAFIVQLPGLGGSTDPELANRGLAIRLRPGERLSNKVEAVRMQSGLYLLYGPSVDQVFRSRDGTGVANDLVPEIELALSEEFFRLMEL